jgi:DNA invertase Pin-like site-specific DNA recombinase
MSFEHRALGDGGKFMRIGYGRVSRFDQNPELQIDALPKAGCEKWFIETISSGQTRRPEWERVNELLRAGDTLVVWALDRLARSTLDLAKIAEDLKARGINLHLVTQGADTSTPSGKMLYDMLAAMAEFERSLIRDRTAAGLRAAKERGRRGGRPKALSEEQRAMVKAMMKQPGLSKGKIAKAVGVSRATVYRAAEKT